MPDENRQEYYYSDNTPQATGRADRRKGSHEGRPTGRSVSSSSSALPKRGSLRDRPDSQLSGTDEIETISSK